MPSRKRQNVAPKASSNPRRGRSLDRPDLSDRPEATLKVRVVPRAGRSEIAGVRGDALLIRLAAAPVDGAANDALLALLAKTLNIPVRQLSIAAGERSRDKRLSIVGLSASEIRERLGRVITVDSQIPDR